MTIYLITEGGAYDAANIPADVDKYATLENFGDWNLIDAPNEKLAFEYAEKCDNSHNRQKYDVRHRKQKDLMNYRSYILYNQSGYAPKWVRNLAIDIEDPQNKRTD